MRKHGLTPIRQEGDVLCAVGGLQPLDDGPGGGGPMHDHAEAVCHAARDCVLAVRAVARELGAPSVGLRAGVHTSRLVSGALGPTRSSYAAWGEAHTHADRLQRLAPLNGVLVSEQTLEAAMGGTALRRAAGRGGGVGDGASSAAPRKPPPQLAFTSQAEHAGTYLLSIPPA